MALETSLSPFTSAPKSPPRAAHSIEVGHFYAAEFHRPGALESQFRQTKLWIDYDSDIQEAKSAGTASTVFLFDDLNLHSSTKPSYYLQRIYEASQSVGLEIDYIAREAAFAKWAVQTIYALKQRTIPGSIDFIRDNKGSADLAITTTSKKGDPSPYAARTGDERFAGTHMIPLYDDSMNKKGIATREWACPLLATIWQLERLGLVDPPMTPTYIGHDWPTARRWSSLPEIMQLNSNAAPFHAESISSFLPKKFLDVEAAVMGLSRILVPPEKLQISHIFLK